jgi:hypothetical protein
MSSLFFPYLELVISLRRWFHAPYRTPKSQADQRRSCRRDHRRRNSRKFCRISDRANGDSLGPSLPVCDIDSDPLALGQTHDAAALQRLGVHEYIFAGAIGGDKAEALQRVEPLDRAGLLDGGAVVRKARTSRSRLRRGAGVDADEVGDLQTSLARAGTDLKRRAGRDVSPARSTTLTCRNASPEPSASSTSQSL